MKKYKLIKDFPGNNEKIGDFACFHSGTFPEYFGKSGKRYLAKEVENYPEFWEEVKYPLSYDELIPGEFYATFFKGQGLYVFKHKCNLWRTPKYEVITSNNGNFTPSNRFTSFREATKKEIEFFSRKDYEILAYKEHDKNSIPNKTYSLIISKVKRLSDNETFQIGDKTNIGTISKFEKVGILNTMIKVYFKDKGNCNVSLNALKKVNTSKEEFPNGFVSWYETFYEVVSFIKNSSLEGRGVLYELAKNLTDKFERLNKDRYWNGDFYDAINIFLEEELK